MNNIGECVWLRKKFFLVKTNKNIRNTTAQQRLTSLERIDIEKDFSIDINTIADDFVSKKDERKRREEIFSK